MFTSLNPSQFQQGLNSLENVASVFDKGFRSLSSASAGYSIQSNSGKDSNHRVNYNYSLIPFIATDSTAEYAEKMTMFSWGNEFATDLLEARGDLGLDRNGNLSSAPYLYNAKRRKTSNGEPPGYNNRQRQSYTEAIIGCNLPILNWLLANKLNSLPDNDFPDICEIIQMFKFLGVCVTQKAVSTRQVPGYAPDNRVMTITGDVDTYNIWGGLRLKQNQLLKVIPGSQIGFVVKAKQVSGGGNPVNLKFNLNGSDNVTVQYGKNIIYQVEPIMIPKGESHLEAVDRNSLYTASGRYEAALIIIGKTLSFPIKQKRVNVENGDEYSRNATKIKTSSIVEVALDYHNTYFM